MQPIQYIERSTGQVKSENPPGEGFLKFLYHHPLGELSLQLLVKRKLLSEVYGRRMKSTASRTQIEPFLETYEIDPGEFEKPVENFESFNDFFIRKLKPGSRIIAEGLTSPADGKVLAFSSVEEVHDFYVKGQRFTLEKFLQNEALAKKHRGSAMVIIRLAPPDYHRFHFPAAGIPQGPVSIKGRYYSVSPYATKENFGRVFCENKRSYTRLDLENGAEIILAPVGATMVGSIFHTYQPDQAIEKGAEMGYFSFGGSSLLMLIEDSAISIDSDLLENTRNGFETSVKMGEQIGKLGA